MNDTNNLTIGGVPGMILACLCMVINQISVSNILEGIIVGLLGGIAGTLGHVLVMVFIKWLRAKFNIKVYDPSEKHKGI